MIGLSFQFEWATATDVGRRRERNEDAVAPSGHGTSSGPLVVVVADGLGGLQAGEEASRRAVRAATAEPATSKASVVDRVQAGNQAVLDFIDSRDDIANSATTLTVAVVSPEAVLDVGHVGDSRLYVASGTEFVQVTTDQTVAQARVDAGQITPGQATQDPGRHILTCACGLPDLKVQHFAGLQLRRGDAVLLCSDGLTEMLDEQAINQLLQAESQAAAAAESLVAAANDAGGVDNITVGVIHVG